MSRRNSKYFFGIKPVINIYLRSCKSHLVTDVSCTVLTRRPLYHCLINRYLQMYHHLRDLLRPIIRHYYHILKVKPALESCGRIVHQERTDF
jgi:hypothetical protein